MKIVIPQNESKALHFVLTPQLPAFGVAGDWTLTCPALSGDTHVPSLDFSFSKDTPPSQRRTEEAILVVELDPAVQSASETWRFYAPGVIFAPGFGDSKDCFSFEMNSDQTAITIRVRCLDDAGEDFKFSFVAMHTDVQTGECKFYASADPSGGIGRD